jgi:hypothetical protein
MMLQANGLTMKIIVVAETYYVCLYSIWNDHIFCSPCLFVWVCVRNRIKNRNFVFEMNYFSFFLKKVWDAQFLINSYFTSTIFLYLSINK